MARIGTIGWRWDPIREMENMERDLNGLLFSGLRRFRADKFPPVNVFTSENDVLITSEIPGVSLEEIDLTVTGDTLTIKGKQQKQGLIEGQTWHRRERRSGDFYRSIQLPFNVDNAKVEAEYTKGILKITLPRAEADKPKKISVKTA